MSTATGMLKGKYTECPKCKSTFLESYMNVGGTEQMCPDCGWTSEDKFDFEIAITG